MPTCLITDGAAPAPHANDLEGGGGGNHGESGTHTHGDGRITHDTHAESQFALPADNTTEASDDFALDEDELGEHVEIHSTAVMAKVMLYEDKVGHLKDVGVATMRAHISAAISGIAAARKTHHSPTPTLSTTRRKS